MLATKIASEINQRWYELEQLSTHDRFHVLESLIERHVLATGPCSTDTYIPSHESYSKFDSREAHHPNSPCSKLPD